MNTEKVNNESRESHELELPILFSGPMVRAILEGRKTQTRRVVKPQPPRSRVMGDTIVYSPVYLGPDVVNDSRPFLRWYGNDLAMYKVRSPYGWPGYRLWVRETWATTEQAGVHAADAGLVYRADEDARHWENTFEGWKWRPSIFMPREFSRITLGVISVRVERLHDIEPEDIEAEGVESGALLDFVDLWDGINGKRKGCGWKDNPWVWVVEFEHRVNYLKKFLKLS